MNEPATDRPSELELRRARRALLRERHGRRLRQGGRRAFAVLPTLLTLGNAACGFGAITFAAKVGPTVTDSGTHLFVSALLIFVAMAFDALDGRAARWAKQTSEFGAQLDSLCDAVSFGVAPAFLMIQFIRFRFGPDFVPPFEYPPRLLWVIALLYVVCAILRLARFNVETGEDDSHEGFSGLPSPAAAGTVASVPLAIGELVDLAGNTTAKTQPVAAFLIPAVLVLLPPITLAVACLMVSRVQYAHLFNQLLTGRRGRRHLILVVFGGATVFLLRETAVPLLFGFFAFFSPLRAAWDKRRRLGKPGPAGHTG